MTTYFDGKHVVITGASGGLGGAVVESFLSAGAVCHLPFIEGGNAEASWAGHERAHIVYDVNLTDEESTAEFYAGLPGLWASIHLVGGFSMAPIADTTLTDLERMFTLNVKTCFLCCREAVKTMRKSSPDGGCIVNVTARPVLQPTPGMLTYTASKAAVAAMTQSLALELHDDHIRVNAIIPSVIDTPANRSAMPDAKHETWPKPNELADAIRFLASPDNRVTSGALVPVYGRA
ncbi:MAG: SDR family NAD(P)-dependent oxidoreductase [Myxococcota bacterium]